jgi:predicted DNA-binding transcriptional regulator YafY
MPSVEQLSFSAVPHSGDEPSEHVARIVSMLVILLRDGFVRFGWYQRQFERSARQFTRDLRHLRTIGEGVGIRISRQTEGRARLLSIAGKNRLSEAVPDRTGILRTIARALGAPVARELEISDEPDDPRRFLTVALPVLLQGSDVAITFAALKDAHRRNARVRFRYLAGKRASTREVEPYKVMVRSGRYYLIGFDVAPRKGWRYFALDAIGGPIARAGTFRPRTIPRAYLDSDAVGMLQGGPSIDVTVRLSPVVAASATSRRWQKAQRVEVRPDGSADITFSVNDAGEAIRWALGFGAEARVIAPPSAVRAARDTVDALRLAYHVEPARERAG